VHTLREVAEDKQAGASSRVAAAKAILDMSVNAIELMDLQERIEMLERSLPAAQGNKAWR